MQNDMLHNRRDRIERGATWLIVAGLFIAFFNTLLDWLFGAPFFGWPTLPRLVPPVWLGEAAWGLALAIPATLALLAGAVWLGRLRDHQDEGEALEVVLARPTTLHPVQQEARPALAPDPALAGLLALHARLYPTSAALVPAAALADVARYITRLERLDAAQRERIEALEGERRTVPEKIQAARSPLLARIEEAEQRAADQLAARQLARQELVAERRHVASLEQQLVSVTPTLERARQREAAAQVAHAAAEREGERHAAALRALPPRPVPLSDGELDAFLATVAFGEHVMPARWQTRLGQRLRAESLALVRVESSELTPSPTAVEAPATGARPGPRGERGGGQPRIRARVRRRIRA